MSGSKLLTSTYNFYRSYPITHFRVNVTLFNVLMNPKFYFSKYAEENKFAKDKLLKESDLTPVKNKDAWDAPEVRTVGDINHTLRLAQFSRRHDISFYLRLVKKAAKEGNTEKMISVLFHDMLITDRVLPNIKFFNILLYNLSNVGGHSEAAFRIFKKMKDIKVQPNMVTYSLVFKCCAREISQHDIYYNINGKGVSLLSESEIEQLQVPAKRSFKIWQSLLEEGIDLDLSATNSLLLTLNRAAMLKESCMVLDQCLQKNVRCDDYTMSAMLEGCLTDRKSGFGLALIFFNLLSSYCRCASSPFVITALLKVAANCQFGNPSLINRLLNSSTVSKQPFIETFNTAIDPRGIVSVNVDTIHNCPQDYNTIIKKTANSYDINVDNFVDTNWSPSNELIYVLKSPTNMLQKRFYNYFDPRWLHTNLSPSAKLACIGGIFGLINMIKQVDLQPNIKTLTSLIRCLPYQATIHQDFPSNDLFVVVLQKMAKHLQIPEDDAFKNAIMKRQIVLGLKSNTASLDMAQFDVYSWSAIAKNCKNVTDLRSFFELLTLNRVIVNDDMMHSLFTSVFTWGSRLFLLHKMKEHNIVPNRELLVVIETEIDKMRSKINDIVDDEKGRRMKELFYTFQRKYAKWLDNVGLESVNTGKRKIVVDSLPPDYKQW